MQFSPNSRNVLPGTVVFTVDIRTPDLEKLTDMRAQIEARGREICEALGVGCEIEPVGHFDPVTFAPDLVSAVRGAAEKLGYSHMDLISGAGHDACWAAKVAPATMVMCPCVDGLSHNEAEEITPRLGGGWHGCFVPCCAGDGAGGFMSTHAHDFVGCICNHCAEDGAPIAQIITTMTGFGSSPAARRSMTRTHLSAYVLLAMRRPSNRIKRA